MSVLIFNFVICIFFAFIYFLNLVARNHLLLQKRDSKSFDVVALHKNQMHEESVAMDEKAHQSLDCGLYADNTKNENVINGDDEIRMTNQSNDGNVHDGNDKPETEEATANEV